MTANATRPIPTRPSPAHDLAPDAGLDVTAAATASGALRCGTTVVRAVYFTLCACCFALTLSGAAAPDNLPVAPRVVETEHYTVFTDLPDDLSRDMIDELEFCYREFGRRLAMFDLAGRHSPKKFNVLLFRRARDYADYTGDRFVNTGGIFSSGREALAVYYEGQGRAQMRKTLRHEAFHQFAHERIGDRLPVWINEGLAQVFEESIRVGDGLRIGLVPPERLRQLRHDAALGWLVDFGTLLRLSDEEWSRTLADRGRAATQYTQAWAMVHFLLYASDATGRPLYRERFNRVLTEIGQGRDGYEAFTAQFGANFDGFRERFETYVAALEPTPDAKALEDQRVLAELLILLRQRRIGFKTVADFRQNVVDNGYRLECRRDEVTWSTESDPSLYFRDRNGRSLTAASLRFVADPAGEMPMLERRPGDGLVYRTRFYRLGERTMHETLCEAGG